MKADGDVLEGNFDAEEITDYGMWKKANGDMY
jgi:hypothetical protein